jgi:hypothetical protein
MCLKCSRTYSVSHIASPHQPRRCKLLHQQGCALSLAPPGALRAAKLALLVCRTAGLPDLLQLLAPDKVPYVWQIWRAGRDCIEVVEHQEITWHSKEKFVVTSEPSLNVSDLLFFCTFPYVLCFSVALICTWHGVA